MNNNTIKLEPVESSQLKAVGYDAETNTLAIEFKSGGVYHYSNFTGKDWSEFNAAKSKGSHFYKHIKPHSNKYPYKRQEEQKEAKK